MGLLIIGLFVGAVLGWIAEHVRCKRIILEKIKYGDKYWDMFQLLTEWINLYERDIKPDVYLEWAGYKTIAVYGNGKMGQCLLKNLRNTDINVSYVIDRRANKMISEVPVLSINDKLPDVDVVIVTVLSDYYAIKNELKSKCTCDIVSINDVIFGSAIQC